MGNHISNLPLQDMIAGVVRSATSKLAADEEAEKKVKDEIKVPSDDDKEKESAGCKKEASWTDPDYVEKLASACDFISQNVDDIDTPDRGVLGNAIAKMAQPADTGVTVPPVNPAGALDATTPPEGKEKYKDDKPLAGYDSAVSQAATPETTGGDAAGKTQIMNNVADAPGPSSGPVPTAEYPVDGPLHSGPSKTAGKMDAVKNAPKRILQLMRGGAEKTTTQSKAMKGLNGGWDTVTKKSKHRPGNRLSDILRSGTENSREARLSAGTRAAGIAGLAGVGIGAKKALGKGDEKLAADVAREKILRKLAGEDTMPAKVTAPTAGGPLVGEGEMPALTAEEVPSLPTDGSGYGNEARKNIQSNEAAINTEKKVKKVQVPQLAQILANPAFSKKHDGRLQEQLRNTGQAGVKIAGAVSEEIIKQAAAEGLINQETINRFAKRAEEAPAATEEGCTCDGAGTCKVCKLKALTEKDSMGDMGGGMGDGMGL